MMASLREGLKKKLWKSGQADRFRPFFPLNMIPWYPKQILLHCEEAEKCIFNVVL